MSFLAETAVPENLISKISVYRGVRRVRILRNSGYPRVFCGVGACEPSRDYTGGSCYGAALWARSLRLYPTCCARLGFRAEPAVALAFIDYCRTVGRRPGHVVDASALRVDVALNGAAIGTDLVRYQADPAAPVLGRHKLTRPQATAGSFCVRFVSDVA